MLILCDTNPYPLQLIQLSAVARTKVALQFYRLGHHELFREGAIPNPVSPRAVSDDPALPTIL